MNKQQNSFDDIIKKAVREEGIEAPSKDFLKNVMTSLDQRMAQEVPYTPLISKRTWMFAITTLLVIAVYSYVSKVTVPILDDTLAGTNIATFLSSLEVKTFHFSKITIYSIAAALAVILFQIPLLKYMFDRRWKQRMA